MIRSPAVRSCCQYSQKCGHGHAHSHSRCGCPPACRRPSRARCPRSLASLLVSSPKCARAHDSPSSFFATSVPGSLDCGSLACSRSSVVCAEDAPLQPLSSGLALPAAARPTADNPLGPLGAPRATPSQPSTSAVGPPPVQQSAARPAGPPPGDYHQQVHFMICHNMVTLCWWPLPCDDMSPLRVCCRVCRTWSRAGGRMPPVPLSTPCAQPLHRGEPPARTRR